MQGNLLLPPRHRWILAEAMPNLGESVWKGGNSSVTKQSLDVFFNMEAVGSQTIFY